MRAYRLIFAALLCASMLTVFPGHTRASTGDVDGHPAADSEIIPGEVAVQFDTELQNAAAQHSFGEAHGLTQASSTPASDWAVLKFGGKESPRDKAAELKKTKGVLNATVNLRTHPAGIPNDPYYPSQWALPRINAPAAWGLSAGTKKYVAILDSGVSYDNYTELGSFVGTSYCPDTSLVDHDGHGTMVAGAAAAAAFNGVGIAGLSYASPLMIIKFWDDDPQWCDAGSIGAGMAIRWAVDHGAGVINCSWSYLGSDSDLAYLKSAVDYAWSKNVPVVAAAGNEGQSDFSDYAPARWYHAISVGATDQNNHRSVWNDGSLVSSNYGTPGLDISAPGSGIWSTGLYGSYVVEDGTSVAAPFVTGTVGLMLRRYPSLTALQVKQRLWTTAQKVGGYSYSWNYLGFNCGGRGQSRELGCGLLDAYAAIR
jgi:subtilisin family serine protease